MPSITAAFSTMLDAERTDTLESDYYASKINQKFQAFDQDLFHTKWFDYRHMTNLQATICYIEAYGEVYRRIYARDLDRARAEHIKPLNIDRMLAGMREGVTKSKVQFVGCWRGRQIADALCMPYGIYIDLAFTYRMRRWQRSYMPQPQHLYHEYDVEKIQDRWTEMKKGRFYLAEHPAYLVQNYAGIAHQNQYHEYLLDQAKDRAIPGEHIARFINEDLLPLDKMRATLDDHTMMMVERYLQ